MRRANLRETTVADLHSLLSELGLEDIVDLGDEYRARCPNNYIKDPRTGLPRHEERHPRHWSINKTTLTHWCFSCHYGGGIHRLVADLTGKNAWDVARYISQYGLSLDRLTSILEKPTFERPKTISEMNLRSFPLPPQRALNNRHLDLESLRRYGIRWNPDTEGWILPIRSPSGELWGWQEKMPDRVMNYPPRVKKSRTLFGLSNIRREWLPQHVPAVVIVESPLDVAYLSIVHEFQPAVASFGSSVSDEQLDLIAQSTPRIILALDNDDSGIRETERIIKTGRHKGIPTSVLNYDGLPKDTDPGEMSPAQIHDAIEEAKDACFWRL